MSNSHHVHSNGVCDYGLISDELITRLCNNRYIQDLAVKAEMTKRQITPMVLNELSARLQILSQNEQSSSVKEFMRRSIAFGHYSTANGIPTAQYRARIIFLPAVLDLLDQVATSKEFEDAMSCEMNWPCCNVRLIFEVITKDLLSHVAPTPPDLSHIISGSDEKSDESCK